MVGDTQLQEFERQLRGIPEGAMRRERVLETLEASAPDEAYALLAAALGRRDVEPPAVPTLRRTLQDLLVEGGASRPLGYDLRADLYAAAAAQDDDFVMRLLRSADCAEEMADPASALPRSIADIPLGMRRSLAKGEDRLLLDRLLLDPDPVVIGNLLENPRLTEDDVVRIAGRRPIPGSTLATVHRSRRFGSRPRVREALACNPYCPTDVAIAALGGLRLPALRDVARDATLHDDVRSHARDELARRSGA